MIHTALLFYAGVAVSLIGAAISIAFWIPQVINRNRLKELLGSRYPLVYVIYIANGPALTALGLLLVLKFR